MPASKLISRMIGTPATDATISEAWESKDIVHMILGLCGDDRECLKKGLGALSKGQLKKVYLAAGGAPSADLDAAAGDDDADDNAPMPSKAKDKDKGGSKDKDKDDDKDKKKD